MAVGCFQDVVLSVDEPERGPIVRVLISIWTHPWSLVCSLFDFKSALLCVGLMSVGVCIARCSKPGVRCKMPRRRKVAILLNADDARVLVSRGFSRPFPRDPTPP